MSNHLLAFVRDLSSSPGIYQFIDSAATVIYVGKAKNLRKRVSSYFSRQLELKTQAMIAKVVKIDVIITATENEALLLEADLIKSLKPRYNVLLRDDKSYPYLYLSSNHRFPRLDFYRGKKHSDGKFFGPYPSAASVRENLLLIQKLFKLRQCRDSFFSNRTRPCLQYQIKRCTAPCVGAVKEADYQRQVAHAVAFLRGKSSEVINELTQSMERAAADLLYEKAAAYRDQISQLRGLQNQQSDMGGSSNLDIIGIAQYSGHTGVTVLSVRDSRLLGKRVYFPQVPAATPLEEALSAFITQYYVNDARCDDLPERIITSHKIADRLWLQDALQKKFSKSIVLVDKKSRLGAKWQTIAVTNTQQALIHLVAEKSQVSAQLSALQQLLALPNPIQRIECFDISHTQGESTVASCVVFGEEGSIKKDYRHYNISNITPGDDYAALHQAILRRYTRLKSAEAVLPDLVIIDGGKGQLQQAVQVFEALQMNDVMLLGVAKGVERKPGMETLWLHGQEKPMSLAQDHLVLHLIQYVRDEAHRFAITSHRAKRAKTRQRSVLEDIEGIGSMRRQQLLIHFGGLQGLQSASLSDIVAVPGISEALAKKIIQFLRGDDEIL